MTVTLQIPKQAGTAACSKLQKDIPLFPRLARTHHKVGNIGVGLWMRGPSLFQSGLKKPKESKQGTNQLSP